MGASDVTAVPVFSQSQDPRQQPLFSLFSTSRLPHPSRVNSDTYRLLIDSRLYWALEPIDDNGSWMFLPSVQASRLAGCLMLTAD